MQRPDDDRERGHRPDERLGGRPVGGELGERLAALYDYMVQRLLFANLHNNIAALDEVAGLLDTLRDAWTQIAPGEQAAA